jgi:diacylglycerol kinase family enzyme
MVAQALPRREPLTPHAQIQRVEVVVNPLSGGVGPKAAAELETLLERYDVQSRVVQVEAGALDLALQGALDAQPDLLVVLAGDGTIRAAGEMVGPEGPLLAPLPGGTMNMLPRALYGTTDWNKALAEALTGGVIRNVCGGEIEGHPFYCAAILGQPALWAEAREAFREKKLSKAWVKGRKALRQAFSGKLHYNVEGGAYRRAEAVAFLTPLISKAMLEEKGLEVAAMDVDGALDAFRLAFNAVARDWRDDPDVDVKPAVEAHVFARRNLPAILDGEPIRLGRRAEVKFAPKAFRALAPRLEKTFT